MRVAVATYEFEGPMCIDPKAGHIYVVKFRGSGAIKVGSTFHPRNRIREHQRASLQIAGHDIDVWVSPVHFGYRENEKDLINWCKNKVGVTHRQRIEYFDLPFESVARKAKSIHRNSRATELKAA